MKTPPNRTGLAGRGPWRPLLWALLLLGASIAFLPLRDGAPRPAARASLRVALPATPHGALLQLAAAEGHFAAAGLDVTLVPVSHGKAAMDLLVDRQVDMAAVSDIPFVIGVLHGLPLRALASMLATSTDTSIVARRDRGIAAPADLVGRRVGVTPGTSNDYFLWAFLIRHAIAPDGISPVPLPPDDMVLPLAAGALDAAALWVPLRRDALDALGDGGVSFGAPDAYVVSHLLVAMDELLRARPTVARQLVAALMRAEASLRDRPDAARAAVAAALELDAATLRADWALLDFRVGLRQALLPAWEEQARWAMQRGHAASGPLPNFLPHVHLDAVEALAPERATVVR